MNIIKMMWQRHVCRVLDARVQRCLDCEACFITSEDEDIRLFFIAQTEIARKERDEYLRLINEQNRA